MNLCRSNKTHNVTPEKNSTKINPFHQIRNNSRVCFKPNEIKVVQLNLGSLSRQDMQNSKQNSKSNKSHPRLPQLIIPKKLKRQERKTHEPLMNLSMECSKKRSQMSLKDKIKQMLLKANQQQLMQKSISQKQYKLLRHDKLFATKINYNNLSMCIGQKQSKKIKKIKENFQKLPQQQLKVTKANVQNWLVDRSIKFPKLRMKKVQTHHIKIF